MPRLLILVAHPALESSRVHGRLLARAPALPGVTLHDLYEAYPDFAVDVAHEQALLEAHDVVLFQHPFYWYSTPPLLKQWEDLVLEHGWAYGSGGTRLQGKRLLNVVSTGGRAAAYRPEGHNRHTVRALLAPIEQTARLCRMTWLPPWVIHGTHRMDDAEIAREASRYERLLRLLHDGRLSPTAEEADAHETLNALAAPLLAADGPAGEEVADDGAASFGSGA